MRMRRVASYGCGELRSLLVKPLTVGTKSIATRLTLAPMAFLSHVALRQLVRGYGGCGLYYSEMCSAKAVLQENRYVSPYFKWHDDEAATLVFQLLGNEPAVMAQAAKHLESFGFFGVDLNFSCAAGVIRKTGGGAALLQKPDLAFAIVAAVRKAVSMPLTVKFRLTDGTPGFAASFAQNLENAGADAITFHPRLSEDRRGRKPYRDAIGKVKQSVNIPVFGNGDIFDAATALTVLRDTGCDGLSLGRITLARPWIFAEMLEGYQSTLEEYRYVALEMARLLAENFPPEQTLRRYQRFMQYFCANFLYGHSFYPKIKTAADMAAAIDATERFFESNPEINALPNMNQFI